MRIKIDNLLKEGKALYLAYDQGIEHGPEDFDDRNVDPTYIIGIAEEGRFNGIIVQKGIAEMYNNEIKRSRVPLIVKLNGKTNLYKGEPIARQICSVKEAINLGAKAVGYTIYIGSKFESEMLKEFDKVQIECHKIGIPVIAWIYPRGKSIKDESKYMVYAARVGLEIGADIIKIKYNGNKEELRWAVKNAGKTKIVIAGGTKKDEESFLKEVREIIDAGAIGLAIGRNIWQNKNPLEITKKIKNEIWKNRKQQK
ncbi:MAG: fructose-bisphosphate aldolase [Candidatus Pacearchaeota archaeon]